MNGKGDECVHNCVHKCVHKEAHMKRGRYEV